MAGPEPAVLAIVCGERAFAAPKINVLFKGNTNGEQKIGLANPLELTQDPRSVPIANLLQQAAQERFGRELDFNGSEVKLNYSAAAVLMPEYLIDIKGSIEVKVLDETEPVPTQELWLLPEVMNSKLATARALQAASRYDALKTIAGVQNIIFSDADFAKLIGKSGGLFCKALEKCKSERTQLDGKLVAQIEERIAKYMADLASLKADLEKQLSVKAEQMAAASAAVRLSTPRCCGLNSLLRPELTGAAACRALRRIATAPTPAAKRVPTPRAALGLSPKCSSPRSCHHTSATATTVRSGSASSPAFWTLSRRRPNSTHRGGQPRRWTTS